MVLPHPALLPQTHSKTAAKQGKAGSTMRPNKQNARENRRGFENRQNSVFLALPNRIRESQGFFFKASLRPFSKVASPHFIYSPEAQSGSTISRKTTERTERAVPPIRAENPYFYNRHRLVLFSNKSKDTMFYYAIQ